MEGAEDKGYVLTALAHRAVGASHFGEPVTFTFTVRVEPAATGSADTSGSVFGYHWETTAGSGGVQKGDWITDVTYEPAALPGGSTVAMETLAIAHEGYFLI
jgi:hypothetical protein